MKKKNILNLSKSSVDVSIICFVQIVVYTTFKYQNHFAEFLTCVKIMI